MGLPSHAVNKQRVCHRDKEVITGQFNKEFHKTVVFLHSERGLGGSHCFWPQKKMKKRLGLSLFRKPVEGHKNKADPERTLVLPRRKRGNAKMQNKALLHIACILLGWAMLWRTRPPCAESVTQEQASVVCMLGGSSQANHLRKLFTKITFHSSSSLSPLVSSAWKSEDSTYLANSGNHEGLSHC